MWISVYVQNHSKPLIEFFETEEEAQNYYVEVLEDNDVEDITDKMLEKREHSFRVQHNDESPYSWHIIIKEVPTTLEAVTE